VTDLTCNTRTRKLKTRKTIIVLLLSLAYFIAIFHRVSPAVFVDQLMLSFNIEAAATAGTLAAIYFYVYFLMQIPAGIIIDLVGPRKVVFAGLLAASTGAVWFGLAGSLAGLFLSRFLIGLGVSVVFISFMQVYTKWFKSYEFGTVMGLTIFAGNLGAVAANTPLAVVIGLFGWRSAFIGLGLVTMVIAWMAWYFIRNEPDELFGTGAAVGRKTTQVQSWSSVLGGIKKVARDPHLWLALAVSFSVYGSLMAIAGVWGVPFLMQVYAMDRSVAATYMLMISTGIMFGSLVAGYISDRIRSRKKPYLFFVLAYAMVWMALTFWNGGAPPHQALFILYFLLGFFGVSVTLSPVMVKEYNPPEVSGVASGLGNMGGFVGSAFMQPFFGYLLDYRWTGTYVEGLKLYTLDSYQFAFMACLLFALLGLVAVSLLRESYKE